MNKRKQVFMEGGRVVDTRMHLMVVSPPGYSKTFWLDQFIEGEYSIVGKTIQTHFEEVMTEAGWSGTIKFRDGVPYELPGAAREYMYGIIGSEEFSALTEMMQAQHSKTLATQLLTSLDKGKVRKRLGGMKIEYDTYATLWAGCQPARLNLTSGLGRRIVFLEFLPTLQDKETIKRARREAKNIRPNIMRLQLIHKKLNELKVKINNIEKVTFDDSVFSFFDSMKVPHIEEILYERVLLGYTLMTESLSENVTVRLDSTSRKLITQEHVWRRSIQRGPEFAEVVLILKEHDNKMPLPALKDELLMFGKDWEASSSILRSMCKMNIISIRGQVVELLERKK